MRTEYVEHSDIGPCLLGRQDLIELAIVIREGLPDEHGFEVLAEFENAQGVWNSIKEFLNHKELPNTPQKLTINAWHPKDYANVREIKKDVRVSFDFFGSSATVSGADETWVIGKHKRIVRFFEEKSNEIRLVAEKAEKIIKSDLSVSVVVGLWVVGLFNLIVNTTLAYAILSAISSAYLMPKYLGWARGWKPRRVKFNLKTRTGPGLLGMEPKEIIPIVISILALIVSVIRIFVP